ncbi:MAG: sulfatase-like hydrolase/transferase [Planctomycetes bacterium]|nr:sulfatase-like hydrolase/transferase [Planctomycetota bacterium]
MPRRFVMHRWFALLLAAISARGAIAAEAAPERLNVVLILLDNCGQEWLGCYGSDEGRTPFIDRLASRGTRFEHCYTFPVCGPSRIQLLTGRYPLRTGFVMHHDAALYGGGGLDPRREVIWPRLFHDAGYVTGIAGKWQVNNMYDEPDILKQHGFDESLVWPGSIDRDRISPGDRRRYDAAIAARDAATLTDLNRFIESRYWDPVIIHNGQREVRRGQFGPDVFQEYALGFLERHRDESFLLYYPMVLTHGQSFTEHVVATPPNRTSGRPEHEMYGEMVQYADQLVHQVEEKLEALKIRQRTILVVATDNGSESSLVARRNGRSARGGLYQLTEAGGDVALIVSDPRNQSASTSPLADFTDVLPTLCDLAGVPVPKSLALDGVSHAATVRGTSPKLAARDWILNQYNIRRVVRDRRYKLYSTGEFFDVEGDRDERQNLAEDTRPEIVAARQRLEKVLASLPVDMPPPIELRSLSAFKLGDAVARPAVRSGTPQH